MTKQSGILISLTFEANLLFFLLLVLATKDEMKKNTVARCASPQSDVHVCCRNNNSFPPTHSHSPLPLVAATTTTSPCSSALSGSRVPAHSDESHASEEKFSTVKSRGAAAAAVRGRYPASRGMEDVAPYQCDEADLICTDIWVQGGRGAAKMKWWFKASNLGGSVEKSLDHWIIFENSNVRNVSFLRGSCSCLFTQCVQFVSSEYVRIPFYKCMLGHV